MANPWLKKNPLMSMWLSGANTIANTARGQVAAEFKRQTTAATNKAISDMATLWIAGLATPPASKPRRQRKR